jgi:hypothetical protein
VPVRHRLRHRAGLERFAHDPQLVLDRPVPAPDRADLDLNPRPPTHSCHALTTLVGARCECRRVGAVRHAADIRDQRSAPQGGRWLTHTNNLSERLLKDIAVTRKNYLFVGSDAGGQRAAIIYTIAETAKLNGLDPEAYIAAILDRLACGHPIGRLDELLLWNFKAHRQPA